MNDNYLSIAEIHIYMKFSKDGESNVMPPCPPYTVLGYIIQYFNFYSFPHPKAWVYSGVSRAIT